MRILHLALAFLLFGIFAASSLATEPVWTTANGSACQDCPSSNVTERCCLPDTPVIEASDCLICCSLQTPEQHELSALTGKYLVDICVCDTGYQPIASTAGTADTTQTVHEQSYVISLHPRRGPPSLLFA